MFLKAHYNFETHWRIPAPLNVVYDLVFDSLAWPKWWKGVLHVEQISTGDAAGIGNVRRYTWKSGLLYRVSFDARTTRIESLSLLEATISGDLEGIGRWYFAQEAGITTVTYEWRVQTTKAWMNLLAPLARALFARNHQALMRQGAEGMERVLGAYFL